MKDRYFIIFTRRGIDRFTRTDSFVLKGGEYAQEVMLEVDDALFQKITVPKVTLHVGSDMSTRRIEPEVEDAESNLPGEEDEPL